MLPSLAPGDRVVVRHGAPARPGSVVVVRLPDDGTGRARPLAVKRLAGIREDGALWVLSDGHGTDSRVLGHLHPSALVAVALLRLPRWRPRRAPLLLRRRPVSSPGHGTAAEGPR